MRHYNSTGHVTEVALPDVLVYLLQEGFLLVVLVISIEIAAVVFAFT